MFFFSKKTMGFFNEKNLIFFQNGKAGKFAVECLSKDNVSWKGLFSIWIEGFLQKSENF